MGPKMIAAQSGDGFLLKAGEFLRVMDLEGSQVADLYCVDLADPADHLSSGRSIDYAETVRFSTGDKLYSHAGNALLEIMEDSVGVHDFWITPCSAQMFRMISGHDGGHPSCQNNLARALGDFGVKENAIGTTFNIFMNVSTGRSGKLKIEPPLSKAGDHILFQALRDLAVGLTACSDPGTNGGKCKPIAYEILEDGAAQKLSKRNL